MTKKQVLLMATPRMMQVPSLSRTEHELRWYVLYRDMGIPPPYGVLSPVLRTMELPPSSDALSTVKGVPLLLGRMARWHSGAISCNLESPSPSGTLSSFKGKLPCQRSTAHHVRGGTGVQDACGIVSTAPGNTHNEVGNTCVGVIMLSVSVACHAVVCQTEA